MTIALLTALLFTFVPSPSPVAASTTVCPAITVDNVEPLCV